MKPRLVALLIGLGCLLAALLVYWFYRDSWSGSEITNNEWPPVGDVVPTDGSDRPMPAFLWRYRSFEAEGIPQTVISLTRQATQSAPAATKIIDEIEGGCNEYPEPDTDVYQHSKMIICYYAGLGRYYKVVRTEQGFTILRRIFEEASPDYDPPAQPYEVIERF